MVIERGHRWLPGHAPFFSLANAIIFLVKHTCAAVPLSKSGVLDTIGKALVWVKVTVREVCQKVLVTSRGQGQDI